MKLVFATHNPGKLKEMKAILADLNIEVMSADEAGVAEDVVEDGKTFSDNALKKAQFVTEKTGEWAVADDSGICIKALNNAPGVISARWAGHNASDKEITEHALAQMKSIPESQRDAYMESTAALASPDGKYWIFTGKVEGRIALTPAGQPRQNMPYDSIFIPRGYQQTFAEMSAEEKNSLSHRGTAFRLLKEFIQKHGFTL